MVYDWLLQPARYGGMNYRELYFPDKFVPCWHDLYGNEREQESGDGRPYPYVPDELKCRIFVTNDHRFNSSRLIKYADHVASHRPSIQLSNLTHFTDTDSFNSIRRQAMIKANTKYLHSDVTGHGNEQDYSFVWLTATVGEHGAGIIRQSIIDRREQIRQFLHYDIGRQDQFAFMADGSNYATSTPFTLSGHPCGERGFEFNIDCLIDHCSQTVCPGHYCQFRCMGTFIYKNEVMYGILVHPCFGTLDPQKRAFFEEFPRLEDGDGGANTVVYREYGCFYWKPFSTSAEFKGRRHPVYCRWDQVVFDFYFPPSYPGFDLRDMEGEDHYSTF